MSGFVIKKCGCGGTDAASYQDKKYGNGNRVMNKSQKGDSATCTVCGKEQKV